MDIQRNPGALPDGEDARARLGLSWLQLAARASASVADARDPSTAATAIAQQSAAFGALAALVFLPDDDGQLQLAGAHNVPLVLQASVRTLTLGVSGLAADGWRSGDLQTALPDQEPAGAEDRARRLIAPDGTRLAMALRHGGETIGLLVLSAKLDSESDRLGIFALVATAPALGACLASARAHALQHRRAARAELLLEAGHALMSGGDLAAVLERIGALARRLTGAEASAVGLLDDHPATRFETWVASGISTEAATLLGAPAQARALVTPVQLQAHTAQREGQPGLPPAHPLLRELLAVPLSCDGRTLANLYVANKGDGTRFGEEDLTALRLLASHAASAIEQARLHEVLIQANALLVDQLGELRRNEVVLRESEEQFRTLAESAEDVLFRIRLSPLRFEYLSPSLHELVGIIPEQAYADPAVLLRQLDPADRPLLDAIARSPETFPGPVLMRFSGAADRPGFVEVRAVPLYEHQDAAVALVGVARDVSERMEAEQEREQLLADVAAERTWLRTVMASSPVGILLFRGTAFEANRRAQELLGISRSAGRDHSEYLALLRHADGRPVLEEELPSTKALRGESVAAQEFGIIQRDGSTLPILCSAAPIRSTGGAVLGASVTFEDLTSVKELARLRDEWTAVIAHDLRQPVHAILLSAGFIERAVANTPNERHSRHILVSAQTLERMIVDLLDASRMEADQLSLEPERVDLPTLVQAVIERRAQTPGRPVTLEMDPDLPAVEADPARLEQVVGNLLSNAVKYGAKDTPVVVGLRRKDAFVEISVTNLGPGIAEHELPNLFRRFHRTANSRRSRISGVGLGLYIARGLVEAHGGRIWAESTPGQTTSFRLTMPLAPPASSRLLVKPPGAASAGASALLLESSLARALSEASLADELSQSESKSPLP